MISPPPIRVGVIGASEERGWARHAHLPALARLPDFEITAVAAPSAGTAERAARGWGARHAFDDPGDLVAHPEVDLVTVPDPSLRRDELVEMMLGAGKHVYCEWPLAGSADAAARYRDKAAGAGVHHAVGLHPRNHPAVRYLRQILSECWIGELLSVSMTCAASTPFFWPQRAREALMTGAADVLLTVGGHALDLFGFAVGELEELSASAATRVHAVTLEGARGCLAVAAPDQVAVHGVLRGGAVASILLTTGSPTGSGYRIEAHGRSGRALLRSNDASLIAPDLALFVSHGRSAAYERLAVPARYGPREGLRDAPAPVRSVGEGYAELAEAIRTGVPTGTSFDTAAAVHGLLAAVEASAVTGTRRTLPAA